MAKVEKAELGAFESVRQRLSAYENIPSDLVDYFFTMVKDKLYYKTEMEYYKNLNEMLVEENKMLKEEIHALN